MAGFDFEKELEIAATLPIPWEKLDNKTLLITGATGLCGKYLIQTIIKRNELKGTATKVVAVGRSREKFCERFSQEIAYAKEAEATYSAASWDFSNVELPCIYFLEQDVQLPCTYDGHLDYIIHMASNTHPRLYASDPIGTEMTNIFGTYYLLELAAKNPGCRFVLTSSGDVYGDNRSGEPYLSEKDCGYIDCNTLRAGYIEGKRASEALCNAFHEAKGVDFVIARLCRIYGPTMQTTDSKAISQFVNKAVAGEDIVLKSAGTQTFSYLYIHDVITALLTIMANGQDTNAYNVADNDQAIALKDLAALLAKAGGTKVIFDLPDSEEAKGASTFQDVRLDGTKLKALGWTREVDMETGLKRTVEELRKK